MRLQGAIFDMDGTLLDSMGAWNSLADRLMAELGFPGDPTLSELIQSMSMHQAAEIIREQYGLRQTVEEIIALSDRLMEDFYRNHVQAKPGVEEFLSILKMEGVWMYVATATNRHLVEAGLRRTGLDRYFRGILTCGEAGKGKDDPLIFEKCLTRMRCQTRDCVVFEDALYAVRTAKGAGFRVAAVYDAFSEADQPELKALADYYVQSFEDWVRLE